MPVVQKYLRGANNPSVLDLPSPSYNRANVRTLHGSIQIASGDDAQSQIFIGRIPSRAIMLPQSLITHGNVTGLTSMHVGVAEDPDLLAAALNLATAGTKNGVAAVSTANLGRRLWELLGFAVDPSREFEIFATLNTNATPASPVDVNFVYLYADQG